MKLSVFSPLIAAQYKGFIFFNFVLGLALIAGLVRTTDFFIVTNIFNYAFWGVLFLFLGIAQFSAYVLNSFTYMRMFLVTGLALQIFWSVALFARQLEVLNGNLFLLIFFMFIAYLKFWLYMYFPSAKEVDRWTQT